MPMYDYRCERCDSVFEIRQTFQASPLTVCPSESAAPGCAAPGEGPVKKVFTDVGISFKGTGFYKNDHGANARGRKAESEARQSGKKEAKAKSTDSSAGDSPSKDGSSSKDSKSGKVKASAGS